MNSYEDLMQAVCCVGAKAAFMADLPRGLKKEKMSQFFSGLEAIKNGMAYDKRYAFKKVRFDRPQMLVFTNTFPDTDLMSVDRWKIYEIDADKKLQYINPGSYSNYRELAEHDDTDPSIVRRKRKHLFEDDGSQWRSYGMQPLVRTLPFFKR